MMLMLCCGCGNGTTSEIPASQNETSVSNGGGKNTASAEDITIELWACQWGNDNYQASLESVAAKCQEALGYTVNVTLLSWSDYQDIVLTAVMSDTAPDILVAGASSPSLYASMGKAMDLTPIYDAWKAENSDILNQIPQHAFDFYTYEGKIVGIPNSQGPSGIMYNTKLFEEAGITEIPTNWDEMYDVCATLKQVYPDKIPIVFSTSPNANTVSTTLYGSNASGPVATDFTPNAQSENTVAMMEIVKKFYDAGFFSEAAASMDVSETGRLYSAEEAIIFIGATPSSIAAGTDLYNNSDFMAPLRGPSLTAEQEPHYQGAYQPYMCFDQSGHAEATMEVVKFFIENNLEVFTEGGDFCYPARQDYAKIIAGDDALRNSYVENIINRTESYTSPLAGMYPWHDTLENRSAPSLAIIEILTGIDVETAVADQAELTRTILEDAGY